MLTARRLMLGLALATFAAPGYLSGADLAAGLRELFSAGAKNTPPAVISARQHYESLKHANPKDSRIDYAYGLVLINQHKYAEAMPLMADHLETARDDLPARYVEIYALIQDRNLQKAFERATALGACFSRQPAAQRQAELQETAEFLGMIFGYLELVRPNTNNSKAISDRKNQIVAQLGETYLPAFDRGRETVATRLAELQAELEAKQQKTLAVAEERQEKAKATIDKDREKAADEKETVQASTAHLRDTDRELGVIQQQLGSLNQDRTLLSAQIVTLQTQLTALLPQQDAGIIDTRRVDDALRLGGPVRRVDTYVNNADIGRWAQARTLAISLGRLNKQAFDMDRQILGLKIRAAKLMGDGAKAAELLEESATLSAKAEKRAVALERQLNRIKTPAAARLSTPRSAAPTGRMAQFSTYVPFPYEQERERVLSWFAK